MARNQKRQTVALRWQRLVTVVGLVTAIAGLTVGYVLQRRAHDELGLQIKATEREIGWITDRIKEGREQVERCRRKDVLVTRANQLGLGLTDIVSSQRLIVPILDGAAAKPHSPWITSPLVTSPGSIKSSSPVKTVSLASAR